MLFTLIVASLFSDFIPVVVCVFMVLGGLVWLVDACIHYPIVAYSVAAIFGLMVIGWIMQFVDYIGVAPQWVHNAVAKQAQGREARQARKRAVARANHDLSWDAYHRQIGRPDLPPPWLAQEPESEPKPTRRDGWSLLTADDIDEIIRLREEAQAHKTQPRA